MARIIQLTRGYEALVSDKDFARINKYSWFACVSSYQVRASRMENRKMIYMHHEVLNLMPWELPTGYEVGHRDRNTLNNQDENLRVVTHTTNMRNTSRHLNRVGYSYNKTAKLYCCYLDEPDKKRKYIGYAKTIEEAIAKVETARGNYN